MKASEQFKDVIKKHLEERAAADELFAATYAKPNKSLDECINYIFQQVQKQGYAGYTDDEIYGMAIHYYDEDEIKDVPKIDCRVVVNRVVELSEEDKAEARKKASEEYREKCMREEAQAAHRKAQAAREAAKAKAKQASDNQSECPTLFDFNEL